MPIGQISVYIISRSYLLVIYEILAKPNPSTKSYIVFFVFLKTMNFDVGPYSMQLRNYYIQILQKPYKHCILII